MNTLCKDCRHFVLNDDWHQDHHKSEYATCARTAVVDGADGRGCKYERNADWLVARMVGRCGTEARFFEPKEASK